MLARWLRWVMAAQVLAFAMLSWLITATFGLHFDMGILLVVVLIIATNSVPPIAASAMALPPRAGLHEPFMPTRWQLLRSAIVEWPIFVALFTLIQPFPDFWLSTSRNRLPKGEGCLVVLVHGYFCNRGIWCWLAAGLRARGLNITAVDLEPPLASIEDLADALASKLDNIVHEQNPKEIVIIAHSMGGLVARTYLQRVEETVVVKLITLGTPHAGTVLARFGAGQNAKQMLVGSRFLNQLRDLTPLNLSMVNIWSWSDTIISPRDKARLMHASEYVIPDLGHMSLLFSKRILLIVLAEIDGASKKERAPAPS